jgi:hypothetical protein
MAIITNLTSRGTSLSGQTFSVKGIELKLGGIYAKLENHGKALVYNHSTQSVELKSFSMSTTGETGTGGTGTIVYDYTLGTLADGGTYDDGLIPLSPETKINDAIDRMNEMLKALAPKSAALVNHITYPSISGLFNTKLSFGNDKNEFPSYIAPLDVAVTRNTAYSRIKQAGVAFTLTFEVNGNEPADAKFPAKVFRDVTAGSLVAYVNGAKVIDRQLSLIPIEGAIINDNGVTLNVGPINYVKLDDGTDLTSAPYRTATLTFNNPHIATTGFVKGWNIVRTGRELEGKSVYSQTVDFILVEAGDVPALVVSAPALSAPVFTGLNYLSGIKYHGSVTYTYTANVNNMYFLVYQSDNTAIKHNATNITPTAIAITGSSLVPSQSTTIPTLATSSDAVTQQLSVTTTLNKTTNTYPTDSFSYTFTAKHPLKGSVNSPSASGNGVLIYTNYGSSTLETEDFRSETFRLQNENYATLPYADIDSKVWDSSAPVNVITDTSHLNGLTLWKNQLVYPKVVGDMSGFGPEGNVNYSSVSGIGTYYRKFKMNSEASMPYIIMDISGTGQFSNTPLNFGGVGVPTNDAITPTGQVIDVSMMIVKSDGEKTGFFNPLVYHNAFGYNGRRYNGSSVVGGGAAISTTNNGLVIDFIQGYTISKNDVIILRIQTADTWTGNINTLKLRYA